MHTPNLVKLFGVILLTPFCKLDHLIIVNFFSMLFKNIAYKNCGQNDNKNIQWYWLLFYTGHDATTAPITKDVYCLLNKEL
jgi:hypothetical protein